MRKVVAFPIPFYTQGVKEDTWEAEGFTDFEDAKSWEQRGCGIASLRMIVDGFCPSQTCGHQGVMIYRGVAAEAYKPGVGWIHRGLADMAATYGIRGVAYREKAIADVVGALRKDCPCILSVTPRYEGGKPDADGNIRPKGGHLVVAYGFEENEKGEVEAILTHHPSCFDEYSKAAWWVTAADMEVSFSGNFIMFERA